MNRIDEIIIFNILSKKAIQNIVDIQIGHVKNRLKEKDISLEISTKALKYLVDEGYNPNYGARPLKRLIQSKILNPVASMMISHNIMNGGKVSVDLKGKEFSFEIKRGSKKILSSNLKRTKVSRRKKEGALA